MTADQAHVATGGLRLTVAELRDQEPVDLGTSAWLRVDQHRVDLFADATDDHQWIHVDAERAAAGPFGRTIAHGYLTLSLVPALLLDLLTVTDQVRGTNYGVNRARFTSPVPVRAEVCLSGRLLEVKSRPDGGLQFKVGVTLHVRDQERPALVAECIYLAYDR